MNISDNPTTRYISEQHNPWVLLLVTLGVAMVGFQFVGAFLGLIIAFPFFDGNLSEFTSALLNPIGKPGMRMPILIMQGVGSITGFIILPWILLKYFYKYSISSFVSRPPTTVLVLTTLVITIFFMGFNAPFIEWNQNLRLPAAFAGLEETLRAMEDTLAKTSLFITEFDNIGQLILGLVVVALIPGIGEELVFRGLVQNHLFQLTKNIHVAIWVGALLFSLFHLQFYGLVPRMLLGAMFGYLYYFSGSIIYPMIAHFMNNGFTLIMLYLYNQGKVEYNIEATETLPWPQIIIATAITGLLFIFFKRTNANEQLD